MSRNDDQPWEGLNGEPPIDHRHPEIGSQPTFATGMPAVIKAVELTVRQMGLGRAVGTMGRVNQVAGFDCPSCAWPDPEGTRSVAEFCENGAKAVASEATLSRADRAFFVKHSVPDLLTRSDAWLEQAGRLAEPMVLREGATHYQPISWDEAFAIIARELNVLPSPDAATFYTSGRTSNEAAFLWQLFARQFGTNNLPDCSNMCHESSGYALGESIGIGKGTVTIDDFGKADSIWIVGQNPGTNHPRMLSSLLAAHRNGCEIVSVNPLREVGVTRFAHPQQVLGLLGRSTALASLHVPVRINGDIAFFKGVMKEMLEREDRSGGVLNGAFIDARTEGFERFAADLREESWDVILSQSGVGREVVSAATDVATRSRRMILCWAMGVTQHVSAVATIQTIVNLALLGGHVGRPGAGLCPVRGHSNVQGDRTMGIWERPPPWINALGREFSFTPPTSHGLDAVESIRAMHDGRVRVFLAMGGNFLSAAPDTHLTAAALRRCSLTAHVSTKLNRSHLVTGRIGLILPCLGRTEQDAGTFSDRFLERVNATLDSYMRDPESEFQAVTVEDSMGKVHLSRGKLPPASEALRSECAIICGIASAALGDRSTVDWDTLATSHDLVRDHIARVVPGFEDFNRRVRQGSGFYVINGPRDGMFTTPSGRAHFIPHAIPRWNLAPNEMLLMTVRTHDQFNTTVYGEDDRYRGIKGGRRVIFMNHDDIAQRGLAAGQRVDITGWSIGRDGARESRVARSFVVVAYDIPRSCAAGYFPELNVLVPIGSVAAGSNQPASKSIVVTVAPARMV